MAQAFQTLQHQQQAPIIITGVPTTRRSQSALAAAPIIDPIMLPEAAKSIAAMILPPDTTTTTTTTASSALPFLLLASSSSSPTTTAEGLSSYDPVDPVGMLSQPTAIAVFVIGLVPWTIATYEFWRRIAVGESFGTKDPVVFTTIGEDDNPASSRGRQVLGKGALLIAYAIFTVVAAVLGLVLYSVLSTPTATVLPPMG